MLDGTKRTNIKSGMSVAIVLKQDQESGLLTDGFISQGDPSFSIGFNFTFERTSFCLSRIF